MQKKELFKELRTEADADQTTPMPEEKAEAPTTRKRGRPKKAAESTPKKPARKPAEAKKETLAEKSAPQDEMPVEGTETPQESKEKKNGRPFSVWLQDEDIEALQLYCDVRKMTVSKTVTNALRLYLAENRPTEAEKEAYFTELDSMKEKVKYL